MGQPTLGEGRTWISAGTSNWGLATSKPNTLFVGVALKTGSPDECLQSRPHYDVSNDNETSTEPTTNVPPRPNGEMVISRTHVFFASALSGTTPSPSKRWAKGATSSR